MAPRSRWSASARPIHAVGVIGAICLGFACGHGDHGSSAAPANAAREGVSIALYAHQARHGGGAFAVVDDRRWIEVAGDSLVIDHVDPGAALASLVIEPLSGGALDVGACLRDRIPDSPPDGDPVPGAARGSAPVLRCVVHGERGRYLVRVLYVSPALDYRAQHDLAMTAPDRAIVASRFAIVTPAWQARAEVTLFDGVPGNAAPPREVARRTIMLDGGTAVIAVPPRAAFAQLRWVYRGAMPDGDDGEARSGAQPAVWVWLELANPALAPGPVRAHVEIAGEATRDIIVPAAGRRQAAAGQRLPLWIDDQLRGKRDRWTSSPNGGIVTDKLAISVGNTGETTRDVWIEEALRPARRRTVARAWPGEPIIANNLVRMKLTVHGGKLERAGLEIVYEP